MRGRWWWAVVLVVIGASIVASNFDTSEPCSGSRSCNNSTTNSTYSKLGAWVVGVIALGMFVGWMVEPRLSMPGTTADAGASMVPSILVSPFTPPDYVFPIAWTILYTLLGVCGWYTWNDPAFTELYKLLYVLQLFLNFSWPPIFFGARLPGIALAVLTCMDILTTALIVMSPKLAAQLMLSPYLAWILFATYLNGYIYLHN